MFDQRSNPFQAEGDWLKANLHCHSTRSDGRKSPQETVEFYHEHGYDALAITDHNVIPLPDALDNRGMVLIPSVEYDVGTAELGDCFHFVLLNVRESPWPSSDRTVERVLALADHPDRLLFLAHPYWSSLLPGDILPIPHIVGLEVINWGTEVTQGIGISSVHWDAVLSQGRRLWGFGVDDAHFRVPDACGGWIMVRTATRAVEGILTALRAGHFYSTMGPEIDDIRWNGDEITVLCSPARAIHCVCDHHLGSSAWAGPGKTIQRCSFKPDKEARYLRVEVVAPDGRRAWSNPFFRVS